MKRFYKLLGIAALAAVIAIGLAGCSTDPGDDGSIDTAKLKGTWVKDDGNFTIILRFGDVQGQGKSAAIDVYYNNLNNPDAFFSGLPGIEGNVIEAGSSSIKVAFEGEKLRVSGATGSFVDADGLYIRQEE
jgi:hypothetical protein